MIFITFEAFTGKKFNYSTCIFDIIKNFNIGKKFVIARKKIKFRRKTKNFAD